MIALAAHERELNGIYLLSELSSRKYERPMLCEYVAIFCRKSFAKSSYSGTITIFEVILSSCKKQMHSM